MKTMQSPGAHCRLDSSALLTFGSQALQKHRQSCNTLFDLYEFQRYEQVLSLHYRKHRLEHRTPPR
jgi:hypothetical protein